MFANRLPRFNPFIPGTSIGLNDHTRSCPNERGMLTFQVILRGSRGVESLSDSTFSSDNDFIGRYTPPTKQPPKILRVICLLSVFIGTLLGIYGILNLNSSTASQQSIMGAAGYLLTVVVPIVLLQLIRMQHDAAVKVNDDEPYNIYGGQKLQSSFLKVVALGLACASLSITVFFWPIAQGFA